MDNKYKSIVVNSSISISLFKVVGIQIYMKAYITCIKCYASYKSFCHKNISHMVSRCNDHR